MLYKSLDWKVMDEVGHLVINQPPANAMTLDFFVELDNLIKIIGTGSDLKGIVISGQGRHFSSGAELNELTNRIENQLQYSGNGKIVKYPDFMQKNLQNLKALNQLRIPVIAAIMGVCIGSAFELALFCHFRFCTGNAVLGLPESTFGLMPGMGGIQKILENTPKLKAMEMVFRGNIINAKEALKTQMIDRIFEKDELMVAAQRLVEIASLKYRKYNKIEYLQQLDLHFQAN
jgi:enoyl-CoA hydratase